MTAWLRRAGSGRLPDGRMLLWSVAEGRRGRRWRSSTVDGAGRVALALLFEVNVDGRFTRLEMTTPNGLLTLHPESDDSRVDGNVVGPTSVRPISLAWGVGRVLWVSGSPIPEILTRRVPGVGVPPTLGLAIDEDLQVMPASQTGEGSAPLADDRGIPMLDAAEEWDLEA